MQTKRDVRGVWLAISAALALGACGDGGGDARAPDAGPGPVGAACERDADCLSGGCVAGACAALTSDAGGREERPDAGAAAPPMDAGGPAPTDASADGAPDGEIPCGAGSCPEGQRCDMSGDFPVCVFETCADISCPADQVCVEGQPGVSGASCEIPRCESDLDCDSQEFCGPEGVCTDDLCRQGTRRCGADGQLFECAANGAAEELVFRCGGRGDFESRCLDDGAGTAYCTCQDDWDCPDQAACEGWDPAAEVWSGRCVHQGAACQLPPEAIGQVETRQELWWGGVNVGYPSEPDPLPADPTPEQQAAHAAQIQAYEQGLSTFFEAAAAEGRPFADFSQASMTPVVANLDDDNGDGLVNDLDTPEIIFVTYRTGAPRRDSAGADFQRNGVLRAIHGGGPNKGRDLFAVCGDQVWREGDPLPADDACAPDEPTLNATASVAVADLNYDGLPEIVAIRENVDKSVDPERFGFEIYDHRGARLLSVDESYVDSLGQARFTRLYPGAAPAVANLDGEGMAEIVIGRLVISLAIDDDGQWGVELVLEGQRATGSNSLGPISCVADLSPGHAGLEVVSGTSLYALPPRPPGVTRPADCSAAERAGDYKAFCAGELTTVWNSSSPDVSPWAFVDESDRRRRGFCAVADVWGADPLVAPGPDNPLDGQPEVVLISNGYLQILDGESGVIIHRRDITTRPYKSLQEREEGVFRGGSPNVDDFDGDGFPEIGAAFSHGYVVSDLQAPTAECPAWRKELDGPQDEAHYLPLNLPDGGVDDDAGVPDNQPRAQDCLHNGWVQHTDDISRATGSSVFDLNGDGRAEVLYKDECHFYIYDGTTGRKLAQDFSTSRTRIEYPVIADVDNDGNAEIVITSSTDTTERFCDGWRDAPGAPRHGLTVLGDANDLWVSARRIWNQHAYHVTNVFESGAVPRRELASWRSYGALSLNTYRSNPRSLPRAPDLVPVGAQLSSPDATCGQLSERLDIATLVENQGDIRVGPELRLGFEGRWGDGDYVDLLDGQGAPLRVELGRSVLAGGRAVVTAHYDAAHNPGQQGLPDQVRVTVDPGDEERECREQNNVLVAAVDAGSLLADLTVSTSSLVADSCVLSATVRNVGSAAAAGAVVHFIKGDPFGGSSEVVAVEAVAEPIAPGEEVQVTASLSWQVLDNEAQLYVLVDPDNSVPECNDSNNAAAVGRGPCDLPLQ